jgi:hypothetical protein
MKKLTDKFITVGKAKQMIVTFSGDGRWCFMLPNSDSPSVWTDYGDTDIDAIYAQLTGTDQIEYNE